MLPKVLVGCPTSFHKEYALNEYAKAVKSLTYSNYDVLLVDNSSDNNYIKKIKKYNLPVIKGPYFESARDRIIASRNILREKTITSYDYFLSLEQDVIPPKDIIEKLLRHNKEAVTGIYFAHNEVDNEIRLIPLAYVQIDDKDLPTMRALEEYEIFSNKLLRIISAGLGCILLHKSILARIKFRYEKDEEGFDDRFFFIDMYKNQMPLYCDASVKCKHLILNRPYSWESIKK